MRMKRGFQRDLAGLAVLFLAGGLEASPLDREHSIRGEDNGANALQESRTPTTASSEERALEELDLAREWDFEQNLNISAEGLFTSDFRVTQYTLQYGHDYKASQWDFGLTYDKYRIDVRSPDFHFNAPLSLPYAKEVSTDAERLLAQLNLTHSLNNRVVWQGQASYYDGFQNFRTLWLRTYYQQKGNAAGFESYPKVLPRGYQLGTQLRWEYLPASGYLEASFSYYEDWIAPSATWGQELELGRGVIDSFAYRLASENVLSPRLRSFLEIQMTDTMARENRWGVQGSLNAALSESLVLRTQGGWVTENPASEAEMSEEFEAFFVGATLECNWADAWLVSVFGRYYCDTGEFQNSLPASNASPGLKSYQVGLGTRWVGEKASVKITAGPYFTRYEAADSDAPFFEDLYKSRDWAAVQFALSMRF